MRTYYKFINYKGSLKKDYFDCKNTIELSGVEAIIHDKDLLSITMIMLNKVFRGTEVLKLTTKELMDNMKLFHDKYHELVQFMNGTFRISPNEIQGYIPVTKFLAAAISHYPEITVVQSEFLQKWFWNTMLHNRYPGSQNERIARDYALLSSEMSLDKVLTKMKNDNTRSFSHLESVSVENIDVIDADYDNKHKQLYKAMMLLLKSRHAKDFYSGLDVKKDGTQSYSLEEHHIFPHNSSLGKDIKLRYKDYRFDIINNVANIALLTKRTNNNRIKAKSPSDYILTFEKEYIEAGKGDEFKSIMYSQFIDDHMIELLKNDDFEGFIVGRTKLLYEKIKELT